MEYPRSVGDIYEGSEDGEAWQHIIESPYSDQVLHDDHHLLQSDSTNLISSEQNAQMMNQTAAQTQPLRQLQSAELRPPFPQSKRKISEITAVDQRTSKKRQYDRAYRQRVKEQKEQIQSTLKRVEDENAELKQKIETLKSTSASVSQERDEFKKERSGSVNLDIHRMTKVVGGVSTGHQDLYNETHPLQKGALEGQEARWCGETPKTCHDTYVSECSSAHGSDSVTWPPIDNVALAVSVGGCHGNFMPGIGLQVSQEEVGFKYRKRQPKDHGCISLILDKLAEAQAKEAEERAKDREALQLLMEKMNQMERHRESMQQMMDKMQNTLSQTLATLNTYAVHPPTAAPFFPPPTMPTQGPSDNRFQMMLPSRHSDSTKTSLVLPQMDDDVYRLTFDSGFQD